MNKPRRKALQALYGQLAEIKDQLDGILSEEEDYRDNIPENMQSGERYEKIDDACNSLSEAVEFVENAYDCIETAMEG
jgi:flagellar biosynthesis chaperone FliJ